MSVAVILAAGRGMRLGAHSARRPKPLTRIHGRSLIQGILSACAQSGVSRAVVVSGYRAEMLERHVRSLRLPLSLVFVRNTCYRCTNNLYSLWLARRYLRDGGLLLEADLLFDPRLLRRLVDSPHADSMVVDRFRAPMNGTVVSRGAGGWVRAMYLGDEQDGLRMQRLYKTVNIYRFSAAYARDMLLPGLQRQVRLKHTGSYYERVISESIRAGAHIHALTTGALKWWEIDTPGDVKTAERMFGSRAYVFQ